MQIVLVFALFCLLILTRSLALDIITTIAGTGTSSFSGDGSSATSATLHSPWGITLDSSSNVYIADYNNCRLRKITASTGIISTISGLSTCGYNGEGIPGTSASLNYPRGVAVDSSGTYIYSKYLLLVLIIFYLS